MPDSPPAHPVQRLRPLVALPPGDAAEVRLEVGPGVLRLRGPDGERAWRAGEDADGLWWDEEADVAVLALRGTAVLSLAGRDFGHRHLRAALDHLGLPQVAPPDGAAKAAAGARDGWLPRRPPGAVLVATLGVLSPAVALLLLGVARVMANVVEPAVVDRYLAVAHVAWLALCLAELVWVWTVLSPRRPRQRPAGRVLRVPHRRRAATGAALLHDGDELVVRTADGLDLRLPLTGPQRVAAVGVRRDPALAGGAAVVLADTADAPLVALPVDPWWSDRAHADGAAADLADRLGVPLRAPLPDPDVPVVGARAGARRWMVLAPALLPVLALTAFLPLLVLRTSPVPALTVAVAVLLLASLVTATVLRLLEGRAVRPVPPGGGEVPAEVDVRDPVPLDADELPGDLTGGRRPGVGVLLLPVAVGLVGLWLAVTGADPATAAWREPVGAVLLTAACLAQAVLLVAPVVRQERRRRRLLHRPDVVAVGERGRLGPRRVLLGLPVGLVEVAVAEGPGAGVRTGPGAAERVVLPSPAPGERGDLLVTDALGEAVLVLDGARWFATPAARRAAADALVARGLAEAPDEGAAYRVPPPPERTGPGAVLASVVAVAPFAVPGVVAVAFPGGGALAPVVTAAGWCTLVAAAAATAHLVTDEAVPGGRRQPPAGPGQEAW